MAHGSEGNQAGFALVASLAAVAVWGLYTIYFFWVLLTPGMGG